jgi:hypothetical protein
MLQTMKQFRVTIILLAVSFGLNAQLNSYDYFREIQPVKENGYYQINIGSGILDREGYYRVYRLSEKDTVEIAHVAEQYNWDFHDKKYFKELKLIDKTYETDKYSYVTLVVDTNILYNTVYLNFTAEEFFKDVTLEGSQDNKSWRTITENEKMFRYFPSSDGGYFRNKIDFDPVSFKYIRVKIDDKESSRLELVSAAIPLVKQETIEEGEAVETFQNRIEDKKNKETIIDCLFPRSYAITDMDVTIENKDPYQRDVIVEFLNPVNGKENWVQFGAGLISSRGKNKIYIPQMGRGDFQFRSGKMRLRIQNRDDQPLGKITVKPFTYREEIRAKLEANNKYVIAYGKKEDILPYYDLYHFKNVISVLSVITLGAEQKIPHVTVPVQQPLISNKMWIWVALTGCVLIIGIFAFRLLKPEEKGS